MTIKDYKDYDVVDFYEEDLFREWVSSADQRLDFFWQAYMKKYPHQKGKMDEARQLIVDTHDYFHQQANGINIPDIDSIPRLKDEFQAAKQVLQAEVKNKNYKLYRIAAVACVLIIASFSLYNYHFQSPTQVDYVTGNAEWKEVTLPDGTHVELNANTQLSLMQEWSKGGDRMVWLKGEAFFEVKKQLSTDAKFTVVTKDLEVEVLGTVFNINTRNHHTEVFLEEGKIVLIIDDTKEIIEPGEFISYSEEGKEVIQRYKKTEEIHSNWKDGVLKINDTTVKEIINKIESIYGIDIISKNDKLLVKEGSVAIPVDNLLMTIAILERTLNIKIEKKGNQLFIN